ncbi:type II secretion system protein GspM [Pseudomonas tructae]|uniref:Type II secretion system protein GspM n=1 Tax=Pseudomonas tructae TaxID=2518644 RepID=A0A411MF31_9PSED|nr:type II secretion system protein GspM [Pseudomonas tructae]QBF25445.1 type II secretion system protein GspM [Pseudomonas tructae]
MSEWVQRRWLMPAAWAMIAGLLLMLVFREGSTRRQDAQQWQALARLAAGLQVEAGLGVERLQQSAQAGSIVLNEVLPETGSWQIKGRAADEQALQNWVLVLQGEGARPLSWALEHTESGMDFQLVLQR